jgi:uncharacterized protein (DUF1330 family)
VVQINGAAHELRAVPAHFIVHFVAPTLPRTEYSGGTIMSAYIVVQVEVTEPAGYDDYKKMVPSSLAAYGGKFVVRGGACETLEGSWQPKRLVVLEFPSVAKAKQWWSSDEYREAKALRQRTATSEMIVVEGAA